MSDSGGMSRRPGAGLIMIVDDTPENLSLLRRMLSAASHETLALPDGPMALKACARRKPDLLLLDVNMPEMDGYEVCRRIKADPGLCDIPVLFLSALGSPSDKAKAFEAGGVDYITKPFQQEEVLARVRTHLGLNRLSRDLAAKNSELSEAHANLVELENARDMLVQTIVHDMRSLLMAVQGYLDLIADTSGDALIEFAPSYAKKALVTTGLLVEMASSVLDVSKMEAKELTLDCQAFDLGGLAVETAAKLDVLRSERKISARTEAPQVIIEGDRNILGRVMLNLLTNAIKFTSPKRGEIEYGAAFLGDGMARFWVSDNGAGIPSGLREKVFEKYWQGIGRQEGYKYGSGLGLTFCRLAVTQHGGRITASERAGGGSVFTVELPVAHVVRRAGEDG